MATNSKPRPERSQAAPAGRPDDGRGEARANGKKTTHKNSRKNNRKGATSRHGSNKTQPRQQPSARRAALAVLSDVLLQDRTLDHAIDRQLAQLDARDRAFAQHLAYATVRRLNSLQAVAALLLDKPLPRKYADIELLLLLGLVQLWDSHVAAHAAVSATVNVCGELGKNWARKLINAGLRRFQREQDVLLMLALTSDANRYATPPWLLQKMQQDWPQRWLSMAQQGLRPAPMWLRVNLARSSRNDYLRLLSEQRIAAAAGNSSADVLLREPLAVEQLPGFAEGLVSVQDSSAQFAAVLLRPDAQDRVLDMCAAPGGKSCQLLEQNPRIKLTSLDLRPPRLQRLRDNFARLGVTGTVLCGDARDCTTGASGWWDGNMFDRILLDAPCSATGVMRRHPDIKWRLQPDKLDDIIKLQQQLLQQAWRLLKPGGRLLYATCSVLQCENDDQISGFLPGHADAKAELIDLSVGQATTHGWQCLTGDGGGDGMYYALLQKTVL